MMNNPFELAQYVGTLLSRKKLKLVTIESCTGGSLAKQITDVPGASEWFDCGLITYSNESKTKLAGVPDDLIRQQGAVSQKVALAMAKGAINVTGSDIALPTTGIAETQWRFTRKTGRYGLFRFRHPNRHLQYG